MRRQDTSALSLAFVAALLAVGCGSGSGPLAPIGPGAGATGATLQGIVVGATVTQQQNPDECGGCATMDGGCASALGRKKGIKVSVVGTNISTTTNDAGEFTLTGLPDGAVTIVFEGPGVSATLTLSGLQSGQVLTLKVSVNGSKAKIVDKDDEGDKDDDDDVDCESGDCDDDVDCESGDCDDDGEGKYYSVSGTITSIEGSEICIDDKTIRVDKKTVVKDQDGLPMPLGSLEVGMYVEVEATKLKDGTIVAYKIKLKDC